MLACDVVIAGGGPAGSACAWMLRRSGLDVVVVDRATFPRDKVCAGWITPQVVADLALDCDDYRRGRTFQPIVGFRVGLIGRRRHVDVAYDHAVSFGILRSEFDHYLLQRSGARLILGTPVRSLRRAGDRWIVNETIEAPLLVGAGGHFCPVARWLNGPCSRNGSALVAAQEMEFAIDPGDASRFSIDPAMPELYFCRDLQGYGWCFRKGDYLNVGFGRLDPHSLPAATSEFVAFLAARGTVPGHMRWRWRGHAYRVNDPAARRVLGEAVMLVGDAAGLAYPQSGEGIRPAIESGLLAAATVVEAGGCYTRERLASYERRVRERFGSPRTPNARWQDLRARLLASVAGGLFAAPAFVRHVVLDRCFLRAGEPAVAIATSRASPVHRSTVSGGAGL